MRIGIIGHFGGSENFNDGQTVKTNSLLEGFTHKNIKHIDKVDTYYAKKNPAKFFLQLFKTVIKDKKIIILLSINGRHYMFPLMYFLSKYLHKEVYNYAIGGRLAREVENNTKWKKYISSFKCNWVESKQIAEQLRILGIKNASYMPNFKNIPVLKETELPKHYEEPFELCTFSRVMEEKGITDAIAAVEEINKKYNKNIVHLDIYGPIDKSYKNFYSLIQQNNSCKYRGIVKANESVSILKKYYLLLFPTHWKHEGIPGTIIDSLSAGVPVVSRCWQYCYEMLDDKVTGYIYNFDEPQKLTDTIEYAIKHVPETICMKKNCLEKAKLYSEDYVMDNIIHQMEL